MDGDDVCDFVETFTATELPHENDWNDRFYSIVFSHIHTCPLIHTHILSLVLYLFLANKMISYRSFNLVLLCVYSVKCRVDYLSYKSPLRTQRMTTCQILDTELV